MRCAGGSGDLIGLLLDTCKSIDNVQQHAEQSLCNILDFPPHGAYLDRYPARQECSRIYAHRVIVITHLSLRGLGHAVPAFGSHCAFGPPDVPR
jgi:hypothetical protein